jgi:hypothetical protein
MVALGQAPRGVHVVTELGEAQRHRRPFGGISGQRLLVVDAHGRRDRARQPVDHDVGEHVIRIEAASIDQAVPGRQPDRRIGQGVGGRLRLLRLEPS